MMEAAFPILLVGSAQRTSLEQMYRRAFLANGATQVNLLDVESGRPAFMRNKVVNRLLPGASHVWASRHLLTHLRNYNRYRWIIIFKGMQFSRQVLEECRTLVPSALWLNINPDDPFNLSSRAASNINVIESLSFFDAYCIWSRSIVNMLRAHGCNKVIYLPFGYDATYHVPQQSLRQMDPACTSFIGSWDRDREAVLAQLAGYNIRIYGNAWEKAARAFPLRNRRALRDVFGNEMGSIMASSTICLNLLRQQNQGSHNMRTFEIPAMGGLMLTQRTAEQQDFFPENVACYMYGDTAELKEKIEYILANSREAELVRTVGMEHARAHSYNNRVRYLLEEMTR